ncbi:MAG: hypothetical protein JWP89_1491 [Schlesneria sp.]|nr:hypothetical protein [Schlesneria sp.]
MRIIFHGWRTLGMFSLILAGAGIAWINSSQDRTVATTPLLSISPEPSQPVTARESVPFSVELPPPTLEVFEETSVAPVSSRLMGVEQRIGITFDGATGEIFDDVSDNEPIKESEVIDNELPPLR